MGNKQTLQEKVRRTLKISAVFVIVFAWIFSGWPQVWQNPEFPPKIEKVMASTTGQVYPTLGETIAESPWLDNTWTTPTNIYSDNTATAHVTAASYDANDQTYVLKATGFDFSSIPDNSTIDGVTIRMNSWYRSGQGSGSVDLCQLLDTSKAKVGTNNCATPVALTTTDSTVITKGSSSDTWGNSLTTAWVKNANFGVAIGILATANNADVDVDYVTIEITYTPPPAVSAPTVTTQAASTVEDTTATCNGTITATGGANATARGCEWDTNSGAPYANSASDTGDFGAVSFTKALSSLPAGTTIYARAFATNSAGTGYGSEVNFLTKPAAPTTVAATDGTYTDKVTITWTQSTGATNYHVWRDTTDLGAAGDVATFNDTGAAAPTVTPGTASSSDGTATDKVTLSISGASANNGTSYTYKVVASNATGNSADSATDTGYRAPGSLTYQWYRSSGDADSGYAALSGATTAPYDDTTAPAPTITAGTASAGDGATTAHVALSISGQSANNGAGRYFYATVSATGASSADTNHDRGYIGVGSLTYQWQRSAADSDASYSNIAGATTASYNDTGAPTDGSGRYYKAVLNATGAAQGTSSADRGYKSIASISLTTGGSIAFGFVANGASTTTSISQIQTVNVNGGPVNLDIKSTVFSDGGNTWTLGAANGANQVKWEFSKDGTNWTTFAAADSYYTFDTGVAQGQTRDVYFRLTMPTSTGYYNQFGSTVTILATAP